MPEFSKQVSKSICFSITVLNFVEENVKITNGSNSSNEICHIVFCLHLVEG